MGKSELFYQRMLRFANITNAIFFVQIHRSRPRLPDVLLLLSSDGVYTTRKLGIRAVNSVYRRLRSMSADISMIATLFVE